MNKLALLLSTLLLVSCGNKSNNGGGGGGGGKPVPVNRVNWAAVPSEFNPSVNEIQFRTDGMEKADVDVFGFVNDVEVVYADMPAGTGTLRAFRVYKESASWGDLRAQYTDKTVNLKNYGTYQCSITVANGSITQLKGGCYVRLQIFLPLGSTVEVYNVGQLLTRRFIPVSTEAFLKNIRAATWAEQKWPVITEYLNSYAGTGRAPELTADQLQTVLRDFMRSEEKLKALTQLHGAVVDRQSLKAILDREFSFRDRDEARRITGI